MVINVSKQNFQRSLSKELVYRDYKSFDRLTFKRKLKEKLHQHINGYKHLEEIFSEVMNTNPLIQKKLLRGNHVRRMKKELRKAVMKGSELENKYVINKTSFVENYRPVSVLLTVSKVFEQIMQKNKLLIIVWEIFLFISMWIQKRIQYTICFVTINRKVEIMPR